MMTIGQHINQARLDRGMSIDELADKADVNRHTLIGWIYQGHLPNIVLLIGIADALEVSLDDLVGRKVKNENQDKLF